LPTLVGLPKLETFAALLGTFFCGLTLIVGLQGLNVTIKIRKNTSRLDSATSFSGDNQWNLLVIPLDLYHDLVIECIFCEVYRSNVAAVLVLAGYFSYPLKLFI
jgi:hypothetical protein